MKIYTYYEDINHPNQEKMIQLWQDSWSSAGFDPVVLKKQNAQTHNFYESFIEEIKKLHFEIMQKEISSYGLSCYVRWLAYATQPKEKFLVSDYDCVNNGLKIEELSDKLHLMDEACPCFVSGSPEQFDKLCHDFITISSERVKDLKKIKNNSPCYHDQEFFQYNFVETYNQKANELLEKYNILMTRDRINGVGPYEINKINTCKVLHISHENANFVKKDNIIFKDYSVNETRIKVMEQIIDKTKENLRINPPESFNSKTYKNLYLSNENYHEREQIYNYYLKYGKQYGHACNHNIIIFYHSPKCAGTSIHYGLILPSLFKQYSCNNNYVYNINWIDEQSSFTLFTTISHTSVEIPFQKILQTHHSNAQDYFRSITVGFNQDNIDILLNQSKLLSIIIKASGFKNSEDYIKLLNQNLNFYDKYIVLREPHSLQESIFYYLRDVGTWEKTHGKFNKTTSYREYIRCPDNLVHWNWLIRQMAQISEQEKIKKCHADLCTNKLNKFSQIGFLEHFDSFVGYLCKKYNWHLDDNSTINLNKNTISKKEKLSEEDNLFLQNKLYYDKEVYDFFLSKYKPNVNIS